MKKTENYIKFWWHNARSVALPQSIMPAILGVILAMNAEEHNLLLGILAILGVGLAHLSMNLFDDYFDYHIKTSEYRENLEKTSKKPIRTGKCDYITNGLATTEDLFFVAGTLLVFAAFLGGIIFSFQGVAIIIIAALAGALGLAYSMPPFKLSYKGYGELVIGVIFGLLVMLGTYYSTAGEITTLVVTLAISVSLLVTNILFTHSVIDYTADNFAGKITLAGVLKTYTAMLKASAFFNFAPFVITLIAVLAGIMPKIYLLTLLALPWASYLFLSIRQFQLNPNAKVIRKKWLGPMEMWDKICMVGRDWFMLRWYLARNILTAYCILAIFATICTLITN